MVVQQRQTQHHRISSFRQSILSVFFCHELGIAYTQGGAAVDTADQQKATAFVEALTDFDKRMNQVVVDSGILQGVSEDRLRSAGAF